MMVFTLAFVGCSRDDQTELFNGVLLSGCDEATGLPIVADAAVQSESSSEIVIESAVTEACGSEVTEYGICYSVDSLPTVANERIAVGVGTGEFTAIMDNLQEFTTYRIRPYAINAKGVAYGVELTFKLKIEIGQIGPAGGLVFYDKGQYTDGWRYLEVAPFSTEWTYIIYGCPGTSIYTSAGIGFGLPNSEGFMTRCGSLSAAAGRCMQLEHNGFDDWFLPSVDELRQVYTNLHLQGIGNFGSTGYWSSTDVSSGNNARTVSFIDGQIEQENKTYPFRVRAARRF